jgi:OmpA-OmpF porin, OOP family
MAVRCRRAVRLMPLLLLLALIPAQAASGDDGVDFYTGVLAGVAVPDSDRAVDPGLNIQGLLGFGLSDLTAIELGGFVHRLDRTTGTGFERSSGLTLDLHIGPRRPGLPFLLIGGGAAYEKSGNQNTVSGLAGAGVGLYLPWAIGRDLLRVELRYNSVFGDDTVIAAGGNDRRDEIRFNVGVAIGALPAVVTTAQVLYPAIDSDGDGVIDALDQCPGTPQWMRVDERGCPLDEDGDGVPDGLDRCPGTAPGAEVDEHGCSAEQRDTDGDGVADAFDRCPDTVPGAEVDEHGCSAEQRDSDGDGVADAFDRCPDTPAGAAVDEHGCSDEQRDSDGDGVVDAFDRCPGTPAGMEVDEKGCPPPGIITDTVIHFLFQSRMTPDAYDRLNAVGSILRGNPNVIVEIGGHADASGTAVTNQRISEERARAVRDYLVWLGVPEQQLRVRGHSTSRPVASNATDEGRAQNRRADFRIVSQ